MLPAAHVGRVVIRATECGGRPEPKGAPPDWDGCADAVTRMVERARDAIPPDGRPYRFYVAGRAALPIFVHLGAQLSRWSMQLTLLNQRADATWDIIDVDGTAGSEPYFDVRGLGGAPSDATGHVAVVVSSQPVATDDQILQFARSQGGARAGTIRALAGGRTLDAATGPRAAQQLVEVMSRVKEAYPHAAGIHLFVAGPATLAVLVGRAINPNVIPEARVANFAAGAYELALVVPRRTSRPGPLDSSPEREAARVMELSQLRAALADLQQTIDVDDVAPTLTAEQARRFVDHVRSLAVAERPNGDSFELSVHERKMSLGRGLLDALASQDPAVAARIAQLVLIHEAFHEQQNLESTNYFGIGRAGFALEEIDYAADAFSAEALIRWQARRDNAASVSTLATQVMRATLVGIEAFDRFEQGDRIERLAERRLRRYLMWHLQHVRAMTVDTLDDVHELLSARLVSELAPLVSYLDARYDKVVRRSLPTTELVVALDGVVARSQAGAGFDPTRLIEAIRTYDVETCMAMAKQVRDSHKHVLLRWCLP